MRSSYLVAAAACAGIASAASPEQWRSRSIYQVITDRFSRPDNSTDAPCDVEDRIYCGGNYKGLIKNLDYIQGMGFDSVGFYTMLCDEIYFNPPVLGLDLSRYKTDRGRNGVRRGVPRLLANGYLRDE